MLSWLRIGLTIEKTQLLFVNLVFNLYSFFLFWYDSLSMAKNRDWINTSNHYYSYTNIFLSISHPKQKLQIIFCISFVTFFTTIFYLFSPFLSKGNQINCHLLPINCLPLAPVQPSLFLPKYNHSVSVNDSFYDKKVGATKTDPDLALRRIQTSYPCYFAHPIKLVPGSVALLNFTYGRGRSPQAQAPKFFPLHVQI